MKWPNPYIYFCTLHFDRVNRYIHIFLKTGFLIRIHYYVRLFFFYISFILFRFFSHSTFQLVHHQKHFVLLSISVCFYDFFFLLLLHIYVANLLYITHKKSTLHCYGVAHLLPFISICS